MPANEDTIDGSCCSICHTYFKNQYKWLAENQNDVFVHGYPVACRPCFDTFPKKVRKLNLQKAVINSVF